MRRYECILVIPRWVSLIRSFIDIGDSRLPAAYVVGDPRFH